MSNKMLFLIILAILVVGIAAAGLIYWQQTKPLRVTDDQIKQAQQQQTPPADVNQLNVTPPTPTPASTSSAPTADANGCTRNFDTAKLANDTVSTQNRQVEIDVKDYGKIVLGFYPSDAPKTVESFLRLTNAGYYDCLVFHRVAAGFVIQGGDPTGTGSGGQSAFGNTFADELNPNTASYKTGYVKGVLAMANSGPNTNGSQFFITLADVSAQLPHSYTIFGHVISGQDVVDKIGLVQTNPQGDGQPVTRVVMQSVKIIK